VNTWDLYFASIIGMNLHPGNNRDNATKMTLKECGDLADQMLAERERRFPEIVEIPDGD
jgi:hypothetical protein